MQKKLIFIQASEGILKIKFETNVILTFKIKKKISKHHYLQDYPL